MFLYSYQNVSGKNKLQTCTSYLVLVIQVEIYSLPLYVIISCSYARANSVSQCDVLIGLQVVAD